MYFTKDTQAAILEYAAAGSDAQRESIWNERIAPAFDKLVENLINVYHFQGTDPFNELKSDCITFLFETMKKFDHTRGTNAFSYFNVVAKNWLIIRSKQRAKKLKYVVSVDDQNMLGKTEQEIIEQYHTIDSQDEIINRRERVGEIIDTIAEIRAELKNPNDFLCIDAISTLFENMHTLDLLNKTAVLLYIKELSGLSQKQLATSLHTIKKCYRELKKNEFKLFS